MGEQAVSEKLKDKVLTIVQCGQYEVIGVITSHKSHPVSGYIWQFEHAMGFRRIGEAVKMESLPGPRVTVRSETFPSMEIELHPGDEGHTALLKSYDAIERQERLQRAGITVAKPSQKGAG